MCPTALCASGCLYLCLSVSLTDECGRGSVWCRLAQPEFITLVAELSQAQEGAAGLLIEVKGATTDKLQQQIHAAQEALKQSGVAFGGQAAAPLGLESYPFRVDPKARGFWG